MIRALIYGLGAVLMLGAAVLYPDFRFLYLLCAVLALGRMTRLIYSAKAPSDSPAATT